MPQCNTRLLPINYRCVYSLRNNLTKSFCTFNNKRYEYLINLWCDQSKSIQNQSDRKVLNKTTCNDYAMTYDARSKEKLTLKNVSSMIKYKELTFDSSNRNQRTYCTNKKHWIYTNSSNQRLYPNSNTKEMSTNTDQRIVTNEKERIGMDIDRRFYTNVNQPISINEKERIHTNISVRFQPKVNQRIFTNTIRLLHTSLMNSKQVVEFNLADIGEGIREVIIKEWNKNIQVGSYINEFDTLCEVESDKATVSITSRYSGKVMKIYYKEGELALVGKPLIDIEIDKNDEPEDKNEKLDDDSAETYENSDKNIEDESGRIEKSSPSKTNEKNIETDLSSNNVTLDGVHKNKNKSIVHRSLQYEPNLFKNAWKILATPSVRRMIKYYNINPKTIKGTGKQGRVLKSDIINYMNSPVVLQEEDSLKNDDDSEDINNRLDFKNHLIIKERIAIKGYIKGMFKSMTEANTIPSLKLTDEIDIGSLQDIRTELRDHFENKHHIKLTYTPFFIKALSLCLEEYSILNSTIDTNHEHIIIHQNHNICIAIDTPHGLVVPNIKHVNQLSILEISKELLRLQNDASRGKISLYDLQNGTISLSNVGNIGGILVQPIIVPKQVCILAFGRLQILPRFDSNMNLIQKSILNITWAADHRVIDGATVARASNLLKHYVQKPTLLLS